MCLGSFSVTLQAFTFKVYYNNNVHLEDIVILGPWILNCRMSAIVMT